MQVGSHVLSPRCLGPRQGPCHRRPKENAHHHHHPPPRQQSLAPPHKRPLSSISSSFGSHGFCSVSAAAIILSAAAFASMSFPFATTCWLISLYRALSSSDSLNAFFHVYCGIGMVSDLDCGKWREKLHLGVYTEPPSVRTL